MTKYLNISTDTTLGGNSPADNVVSSQKAIKDYVDTKQDTLTAGTGIDITNNTVSVTAPTVINTATGNGVLTILGTPTSETDSMNIGKGTSVSGSYSFCFGLNSSATGASAFSIGRNTKAVGSASMAMGLNAETNGNYSVAIGRLAKANASNTIQIGYGTNTTEYTLAVGFYGNSSTYTLLDGTTGLIPTARLADTTSATQGQVLTLDSSLNAVWANSGGGGSLPDQTGHAGEFLTTNGSTASWANAPTELPTQTGHSGEFLTTDGTNASWSGFPHIVAKQDPSSANGYSWYRKWSDGWVEQGGFVQTTGTSTPAQINFPIAMADTTYNYQTTPAGDGVVVCAWQVNTTNMTVIGVVRNVGYFSVVAAWRVAGPAA